MSDNAAENEAEKSESQLDKHSRTGAADLEKVTDFHEETDEMNAISTESIGQLKAAPQQNHRVIIKKEDIQLIIDELEVTRFLAEKKLVQHNGDVSAALKDLMGFS